MMSLALVARAIPEAPGLGLPAFAYASQCVQVDDAFMDYDTSNEDCLLDAFARACDVTAFAVTTTADMGEIRLPKSFDKAVVETNPHSEYWIAAINKELSGLVALGTWELVYLDEHPDVNVMFCHYIFTVKRLRDGSIEKFKARLVANGNTQQYGVDFDHVFSTVVKTCTIRVALIIAAARDYNLSSIDIRQAYLQAKLTEDLYMRVPQGIPHKGKGGRLLICKLQRSLYGLKQAGRLWAALFSSFIVDWGFERSTVDTCLYTYTNGNDILWLMVHVDDALIVDNNPALRDRFVAALGDVKKGGFPTEDKGEATWLLGIGIDRDRENHTITLSQKMFVTDLVSKHAEYIDTTTRSYDTPLAESTNLSSTDSPVVDSIEYKEMTDKRVVYMQLVGAYLWLANMTFFELIYPSSQLGRFLSNPGDEHFKAAIRVLVYLRDRVDQSLHYAPNSSRGFETYVDSNWSSKFSCSGALYMYHGCMFHWFSKMQKSVTLSSAEAEYFGAMLATRDGMFVRDVLLDLNLEVEGAFRLYTDSASAVTLSFDPVAFKNTKHILRAANFLRDLVAREVVYLQHVPGRTMIADLFTKAVSRVIFVELMRLIREFPTSGVVVISGPPDASV